MNRAELYDPYTRRLRPLPVAVSFNADPADQMAAARRLAQAARLNIGGLAMRQHADDPVARVQVSVSRARLSRPLPPARVPLQRRRRVRAEQTPAAPVVASSPPRDWARDRLSIMEVKACLDRCGDPNGMSNAEVARALGAPHKAVGPFLGSLVRAGHAYTTGERYAYRYHPAR